MASPPPSGIREFAEAISSATDPMLANWQERGLENPTSLPGVIVWSITGVSVTAGLVILFLGVKHIVLPSILLVFEPAPVRPRGGFLTLTFALAAIAASGVTAFAVFQGGTRLAFALTRRKK